MAFVADEFDLIVNTWTKGQADRRGERRAVEGETTDEGDPGSTDGVPDDSGDTTGADLVESPSTVRRSRV